MAGGSLLMLLDDIAAVLDDVAVMTKVAARKTAGVLGDDLALNAQQLMGISARRELPVVWAVAKGSFINKLILVPLALLISFFIPWAITPLLMVGGAFLCYEGCEKLLHRFLHRAENTESVQQATEAELTVKTPEEIAAFEKSKIRGAVRTDFILSAEIIAIALGSVSSTPLLTQVLVISSIALLVTVGVYGLVGMIVKMDDLGFYLEQKKNNALRLLGGWIIGAAPWLMRGLSVIGTAAMFLVGGGILVHGFPWLNRLIESSTHGGGLWNSALNTAFIAIAGIVAGAIVLAVIKLIQRAVPKSA